MTLGEALRRSETGDWVSWCDSDSVEMQRLRYIWSLGRRVRNSAVQARDEGRPFNELVELLREIKQACHEQFDGWQPMSSQRRRPN